MRGDSFFPTSIAGRFSILCTILRQLSLVASTGLASSELQELDPDVLIVDQLSACIPFFRLIYPKAKVLFYGHFPDQLLVQQEHGIRQKLKSLYRIPFDAFEAWSTGCADSIVVNSKFTRSIFKTTLPGVKTRELKVIYPCVDTSAAKEDGGNSPIWPDSKLLLSINRFEGKKMLDLAIRAFAGLAPEDRSKAKLVLAGGYDPRNAENALTHKKLQELSTFLKLTHATFRANDPALTDLSTADVDILFLLSISNELKTRLLSSASLLIYTPTNEHFGIVPLEAMLAGVPVLATNTGGPLETIYDGRTGWLRNPDKVEEWTKVMQKPLIPSSTDKLRAMGRSGREQVLAQFSRTKMAASFDDEVQRMLQTEAPRPTIFFHISYLLMIGLLTVIVAMGAILYKASFA